LPTDKNAEESEQNDEEEEEEDDDGEKEEEEKGTATRATTRAASRLEAERYFNSSSWTQININDTNINILISGNIITSISGCLFLWTHNVQQVINQTHS